LIAASEQARAAKADLIVTVGGGSITDGAKAVQLCLANDISDVDGIERIRARGGVPPAMKSAGRCGQISVPTTIAGGEFSAIAGVTNEATKGKEMLAHRLTIPRAVILDPALSVHTPEWLFCRPAIRAVDHCVEGICSGDAHPYGDAQALKGLAMLAQGLPRVKADKKRISTRGWIARSAPGFPPGRSPPACRWARATASAMCSAPNSACRTAIPPA